MQTPEIQYFAKLQPGLQATSWGFSKYWEPLKFFLMKNHGLAILSLLSFS